MFEYLGARREGGAVVFRVWAPNADAVYVCGDFNGWIPHGHPMKRVTMAGIWETKLRADSVPEGSLYKYYIRNGDRGFYKADPCGTAMGCPPETASVYAPQNAYPWRDDGWLCYRRERFSRGEATRQPVNVYEMHLGSWKRRANGGYLTYSEIAAEAAPYLKQMGYTHVALLPVAEHPNDASLGYAACGFYAPTARFGSPEDLMAMVDAFHEAGIGVILHWVPTHFPRDEHGPFCFDGAPLYEQSSPNRWEGADGSLRFDLSREEVRSFLISNAVYWVSRFHVDGLWIEDVALLTGGQNSPEEQRAGADFLRTLNGMLGKEFPDVITLAGDVGGCESVTGFENGGLGFTLRADGGWEQRLLAYSATDPIRRQYSHTHLNASIIYAFAQRYLLSFSRGSAREASLLSRMFGDSRQREAGARLFLLYLITHPGKKSVFMGTELGISHGWDPFRGLPWENAEEAQRQLQYYTACLNRLYLKEPALWQSEEAYGEGFAWIDPDNGEQSILSFCRRDARGEELTVLLNFTPVRREGFLLAVPREGCYREVFSTELAEFGGSGCVNPGAYATEPCNLRGYCQAIRITVPPLGGAVFRLS